MRSDICLLLTSTIEVASKGFVKRHDTRERLDDYKGALVKWLTRQDVLSNIVFADNSGFPLDELEAICDKHNHRGKQVEFLSFQTEGYPAGQGRSFGEIDTIKNALVRSCLLGNTKYFAKVTGRLYIPNISSIIARIPQEFDVIARFSNNLAYTDTTLILFRTDFFAQRILPFARRSVDDENREYIERVFMKAILRCIADDYRWFPFPYEPVIDGMSGTKDKPYGRGRLASIKGTLVSRLFYDYYRTVYSSKPPHILDIWKKRPTDEPTEQ